jgi:hypothetical protein
LKENVMAQIPGSKARANYAKVVYGDPPQSAKANHGGAGRREPGRAGGVRCRIHAIPFAQEVAPVSAICENVSCLLSYQAHDGKALLDLIHVFEANHAANVTPAPGNITRLTELTKRIYQRGPSCSACGQRMARFPGPIEPDEVNYFLSNIEPLKKYHVR